MKSKPPCLLVNIDEVSLVPFQDTYLIIENQTFVLHCPAVSFPESHSKLELFERYFLYLQDMSVPEHARNSFHAFGGYEGWVEHTRLYNSQLFNSLLASGTSNTYFDFTELQKPSPFDAAPIPIARLFDSRQYSTTNSDGSPNLQPNLTMNQNIGLSEYTNANFVSPTTIFIEPFSYPSPTTSVQPIVVKIPDVFNPGQEVNRTYYEKTGDGDTGYLLALKTLLVEVNSAVNPVLATSL